MIKINWQNIAESLSRELDRPFKLEGYREVRGGCINRAFVLPSDEGYATRKLVYNLYHILNHLNLFGGDYLSQAESIIERLLGELG